MIKKIRFLYPGLKMKRWFLLLVVSVFITIIGIVKALSDILTGFHIKIIPDATIERIRDYIIGLKFIDFVAIIVGIAGLIIAFRQIIKSLVITYLPERSDDFEDYAYKRILLRKGPKIVAIGGGTGLPAVLSGIKEYTSNITAIVTVADDGGSSGKIRQIFKIPPPGDLRNCIVALADTTLMAKLFQYRFKEHAFDGHSFGNIFITAMSEITGDFEKAIKESSKILSIRGSVVPVTLERVIIGAELVDDSVVEGETKVSQSKSKIKRVFLKPADAEPTQESLHAIRRADAIILGPGSLYTSIIPNLLVKGISEEIINAKVIKIYVCNIMTQYGETTGYNVFDHVDALVKHSGENIINHIIVNTEEIPNELLQKYANENSYPVELDEKILNSKKYKIIKANLLKEDNKFIRHDPVKLAKVIIKILSV